MNFMYFRNESLTRLGPNVTIRRGEKWNKLNPGDRFELVETGTCNNMGFGTVKDTMFLPFRQVPEYVFDPAILPMTQSRSCTLRELQSNYEDFEENEDVTVVLFDLI